MTELFDPVNNEFLTRSFPNSPAATSRLYLLCRCSHQLILQITLCAEQNFRVTALA